VRLPFGTIIDVYLVKKDGVGYGGMMSVAMVREGKGAVMKALMERERLRDRICRAIKPICTCFSFAARQAREAEIDIPSRRSFRQMFASGEGPIALPKDEGTGVREAMVRTGIGMRTFLECLDDARSQAEQSRTDLSTRMSYRKLPE
jgi:hypothetical protein